MFEIGGYFGLEQLVSNEFYDGLIALNSGRNALIYILIAKKIRKLFIPFFLCDDIREILKLYNYYYDYYSIDENFLPIFDRELLEEEAIFVVNYYGFLTNFKIAELKDKFNNIIIDNTQAFFQKPVDQLDTIYSCRKFFGVPDGAYLSTNTAINDYLEADRSFLKLEHLLGRFEGNAADYFIDFQKNEKMMRNETVKFMSKLTHNILGAVDYTKVINKRTENFIYLNHGLGIYNRFKLSRIEGAFAYPFYINCGQTLRKKLLEKKIYIPILWPHILNELNKNTTEYQFASNVLPLPCDQRYGVYEMNIIIESILGIIEYGK